MPRFFLFILTSLLIALDFFSKFFVEKKLFGSMKWVCDQQLANYSYATPDYCQNNLIQWNDFLSLHLSYNSGVAFSLPIHGLPLQIITVGIIGFLLYYFFHEEYPKKSKLLDVGYAMIFAGAISHAYERILVGHVVDFIAVKYFAILNFADIFISVGAFLIFLSYFYARKRP